jgi:hypothetical protein
VQAFRAFFGGAIGLCQLSLLHCLEDLTMRRPIEHWEKYLVRASIFFYVPAREIDATVRHQTVFGQHYIYGRPIYGGRSSAIDTKSDFLIKS